MHQKENESYLSEEDNDIASVLSHQEWKIWLGWVILQHETADLQ